MDSEKIKKSAGFLLKNKYVLLVLLAGAVLMLLPSTKSESAEQTQQSGQALEAPVFSIEEAESRLKKALSQIDGAGDVSVLLSLKRTSYREIAESAGEALVVSTGSGAQDAVELSYTYPEYLGAVVVCQGAGNAKVKLEITKAVASFTGLGSDKITVIKMK